MKVAIIGAGIAGLACGLELQRCGVTPDIYEQRYFPGEPYPLAAVMLNLRLFAQEPLACLKKHQLPLKPLQPIKRIIIHSPHEQLYLKGNLGYFVAQGQGEQGICSQWQQRFNTAIALKTSADYFKIREHYDWVVLADGSPSIPLMLNLWQPNLHVWIRGANIVGDFNPQQAEVWLDREFAREGFAYLAPLGKQTASLVLAVTGISRQELHDYWDTFMRKTPFNPQATGYFELEFQTGSVSKHQVDNTLLVGNAGGFGDLLFGQGVIMSALSGVEAARAIVQQDHYGQRIKYLVQTKEQLNHWQQSLDQLNNRGLDMLLKLVKIPGVKSSKGLIRLMSSIAAGWGSNKENIL